MERSCSPVPIPRERLDAVVTLLRPYAPVAVYAFGSRVTGEARPDSDLDLAILLPDGASLPLGQKMHLLPKLEDAAGCEVDLVVLNGAGLPIAFEIIRQGCVLYESSSDERTDAEDLIVRDWLDFRPVLERSYREILDEVRESRRPYGLNLSLVAGHIQIVRESLARLEPLAALGQEQLTSLPDGYAIAEHHLRRALQALLDLGRHIAVKSAWGNPGNYREIFDLLEKGRVLAQALAEKGRALAGCRNRLVHEYAAVTCDELWGLMQGCRGGSTDMLRAYGECNPQAAAQTTNWLPGAPGREYSSSPDLTSLSC